MLVKKSWSRLFEDENDEAKTFVCDLDNNKVVIEIKNQYYKYSLK